MVLDFIGSLNERAASAAAGHQSVVGHVTLNTSIICLVKPLEAGLTLDVVVLPGLGPQHHDGDAGRDAAQEEVQAAALPQIFCCVV